MKKMLTVKEKLAVQKSTFAFDFYKKWEKRVKLSGNAWRYNPEKEIEHIKLEIEGNRHIITIKSKM